MKQEENRHELILPNEDISFKMFLFEGKEGHYFRDKHWHRSVELFAVLEGEREFYLDEEKHHLTAEQFMLVNSNEMHAIHALRPNQTVVLQIPVSTFRRYYQNNSFIWFSHSRQDADAEVMRLVRDMYEIYEKKETGYDLAVQSLFYQLLYLLVLKYRESAIDPVLLWQSRNRNRLSEIMEYMKEHYETDLSLSYLGEVFGYSPTYLSKMFRKYSGCGFKKYLESIRLEHAVRDFTYTKDSMEEIAARHGFSDRKALRKAFQEKYQISPRQFRTRNKTDL